VRHAPLILLAAFLAACDRPAYEGVRDWTPQDHDKVEENSKQRAKGKKTDGPSSGSASPGSGGDASSLVEATWRTQCAQCHGPIGKGDGPTGPMVRAKDLTSPEWQAQITDAQMAASIRNGKDRMPKFDLPDAVVAGLIVRIRLAKGQ
jgi:mono/diheme cytochrome c family protein